MCVSVKETVRQENTKFDRLMLYNIPTIKVEELRMVVFLVLEYYSLILGIFKLGKSYQTGNKQGNCDLVLTKIYIYYHRLPQSLNPFPILKDCVKMFLKISKIGIVQIRNG